VRPSRLPRVRARCAELPREHLVPRLDLLLSTGRQSRRSALMFVVSVAGSASSAQVSVGQLQDYFRRAIGGLQCGVAIG